MRCPGCRTSALLREQMTSARDAHAQGKEDASLRQSRSRRSTASDEELYKSACRVVLPKLFENGLSLEPDFRVLGSKSPIIYAGVMRPPAPPLLISRTKEYFTFKISGAFLARPEAKNSHQIPLSLPVIFCPTSAAVASHGKRLRRAPLSNCRRRITLANCEP